MLAIKKKPERKEQKKRLGFTTWLRLKLLGKDKEAVAVDSKNHVHVAYRRYIDDLERWQIVHRWSDDGLTWSAEKESIIWSDLSQPEWRYISIDIDSLDRIHIAFHEGAKIHYTRSYNGIDWMQPEWVNKSIADIVGVWDHQPWMFVDADDQIHIIWARLPVIPNPNPARWIYKFWNRIKIINKILSIIASTGFQQKPGGITLDYTVKKLRLSPFSEQSHLVISIIPEDGINDFRVFRLVVVPGTIVCNR